MQGAVADTRSALRAVAEASAAGALPADTRRGKQTEINTGGLNENVPNRLICFPQLMILFGQN